MKTKLITALRTAATALENGTFAYDWGRANSCNCGIIASTLLHKSIDSLKPIMPVMEQDHGSWRETVGRHCPVTGMSENVVLRAMQEAGMSQLDIVQLEDLSNPEVLKRFEVTTKQTKTKVVGYRTEVTQHPIRRTFMQVLRRSPIQHESRESQVPIEKREEVMVPVKVRRDDKSHAIAYMRAWADLLNEQGKQDAPESPLTMTEIPATLTSQDS